MKRWETERSNSLSESAQWRKTVQVPEYTWSTSWWISVYAPLIVWRLQQKHSSDSPLSGNCVTVASPGSSTCLHVCPTACAVPDSGEKQVQNLPITFTCGKNELADKLRLRCEKKQQCLGIIYYLKTGHYSSWCALLKIEARTVRTEVHCSWKAYNGVPNPYYILILYRFLACSMFTLQMWQKWSILQTVCIN